jgi:CheY-like chemotaxis protein
LSPPEGPAAPFTSDELAAPAVRLTVLVAEDGEVNQEVARTMLELRGHHVWVAGNGAEALAVLDLHDVDVVLMDVQMPVMDGFEATRSIRQAERAGGRHRRIIGVSAHALRGFRDRCLDAGMDDFISKPVSMRELYRAVEGSRERPAARAAAALPIAETAPASARVVALQRVGGVDATLRAIVPAFQREVQKQLAQIEQALAANAPAELTRAAHTLKGSADTLGFTALADLAMAAERQSEQGDLAAVRRTLVELKPAVAAAVAETATW